MGVNFWGPLKLFLAMGWLPWAYAPADMSIVAAMAAANKILECKDLICCYLNNLRTNAAMSATRTMSMSGVSDEPVWPEAGDAGWAARRVKEDM